MFYWPRRCDLLTSSDVCAVQRFDASVLHLRLKAVSSGRDYCMHHMCVGLRPMYPIVSTLLTDWAVQTRHNQQQAATTALHHPSEIRHWPVLYISHITVHARS